MPATPRQVSCCIALPNHKIIFKRNLNRITSRIKTVYVKFYFPLRTIRKRADILAAMTFSRQLIPKVIYSPPFPSRPSHHSNCLCQRKAGLSSHESQANHTQNSYIGHYRAKRALHHASKGFWLVPICQ